jgi:hypothetical protein
VLRSILEGSPLCRCVVSGAALLMVLSVASPAAASPETLKRAVSNILFGPTDVALGPIVGARSVYHNIQDIDDTPGVRIAFIIPGVAWNGAMCMAGGVLRTLTGVLEFIPGLILLPFEADMDALFAPPGRADALIDEETDFLDIKIGIDYVS